jgi:hypothetical protein
MKRAWLGVIVVLGCVVPGCKSGPSEDQCKQLLDHLVDLEFKKAGAAATTDAMKADLAKSKSAVTEAKSAEFLKTCTNKMSRSRVECALAANELDGDNGVGKCDEAK